MPPSTGGKGSHGGYCGPAVKPIALNMVAEIARDPPPPACRSRASAASAPGATRWSSSRWARQRAGLHRRHGLRLQDRAGDERRPVQLHGREGLHQRGRRLCGRAVPTVTDWQYLNLNHISKAVINQDRCIQCGRCHIACEDTSHQAITRAEGRQAPLRGEGGRVRRLQPVRDGVPGARCITLRTWRLARWTSAPANRSAAPTPTGPPTPTTRSALARPDPRRPHDFRKPAAADSAPPTTLTGRWSRCARCRSRTPASRR